MGRFLNWIIDVLLALVAIGLILLILGTELNFGERANFVVKILGCAVLGSLALAAVLDAVRPSDEEEEKPKRRSRPKRKQARARGTEPRSRSHKKKTSVVRSRTKSR